MSDFNKGIDCNNAKFEITPSKEPRITHNVASTNSESHCIFSITIGDFETEDVLDGIGSITPINFTNDNIVPILIKSMANVGAEYPISTFEIDPLNSGAAVILKIAMISIKDNFFEICHKLCISESCRV